MDSIARSLHLGNNKLSEFTAHVHILDLFNVPLVEGECRIKWKFKGGISLNSTNNDKVMGQALQSSRSYLTDIRDGVTATAASGEKDRDNSSRGESPNTSHRMSRSGTASSQFDEHQHGQSIGDKFRDVLFHPQRTLRASASGSPPPPPSGPQSPRGRSHSGPPQHSPTGKPLANTEGGELLKRIVTPPTRTSRNPEATNDPVKTPRQTSQQNGYFGGPLSPTTTISPITPGASDPLRDNYLSPSATLRSPSAEKPTTTRTGHSRGERNDGTGLRHTATLEHSPPAGLTPARTHTTLSESLKKSNMPAKAESKGKTPFLPLRQNAVQFDKHVLCAVAIPISKTSRNLEESVVKLKISYRVRTTALPHKIGSKPAPPSSSPSQTDPDDSSSVASDKRTHKTRMNGTTVSISTSSGSSTPMINAKEAHEEIHLGDLWLNLSEFVSADWKSAADGNTGHKPGLPERWITRRYLLQNGRTNALLRVAVKMDWLSGVRDFTA